MNGTPQYFAIALRPVSPRDTLVLRRRPAATEPPPVPSDATEVAEAKLLAILDAPLSAFESPTEGFDRKERALGNAFTTLTRPQLRALSQRLEINYTRDTLARKFNALNEARRERLLGFLRGLAD